MLNTFDDVLTKDDLSKVLKIPRSTLDTMCSRKPEHLPNFFKLGNAKNSPIRFLKRDVIHFLENEVSRYE